MPVVKSDRPPAKMADPAFNLSDNGSNIFLVDKVKYHKITLSMSSILGLKQTDSENVGCFKISDLQNLNSGRYPLFTMQADLVAQLMDIDLYVGGLTNAADFQILVKRVTLPRIYDKQVEKYLKKYPFEVAASLLHHYGQKATPFINRYARKMDPDQSPVSSHGARIFTKGHRDAPKAFIPFLYKFGCRFVEA